MGLTSRRWFSLIVVSVVIFICNAKNAEKVTEKVQTLEKLEIQGREAGELFGGLIEQGRSMIHHLGKRFMILLPAIFFKLGIAFTMLVLVAIASVNNGFIGFLLLVVGLSSVLARLQDTRKPAAAPYYLPAYHHHAAIHHGWDRSDKKVEERPETTMTQAYPAQQQFVYPQLSTYNPAYYGQNN